MTIQQLIDLANSEVLFAVLFIAGLIWFVKDRNADEDVMKEEHRKREEYILEMNRQQLEKAWEREEELMKYLERNNDQLAQIAETLDKVHQEISKVEDRMEDNFMTVWKELGQKQDKPKGDD